MYDWVFMLAYLAFQVLIGLYLTKFIKNEGDYFLGGRNIPTYALSFSIFATWFGAETCIGSSAAVFESGLSGSKAEPFGYGMCLILVGLLLAPRIYNERYTTLGDFFKDKFGQSTERLAIWVMVPSSLIWGAAQIKAFGQVIAATSPLPLTASITVATCFVVAYTMMGGLLGDVVTDVLQGVILALCLLVMIVMIFVQLGGAMPALATIAPEKLSFITEDQSLLERIDSWLVPILGSLVAQEMIARLLAAKNRQSAIRSSFFGAGIYIFFGCIPVLIGLLGHNFPLALEESEQFLPTLSKNILPHWAYLLLIGALVSAILSTIDSIFLAISALITHNLLVPAMKITNEKRKVFVARMVVMVSAIIAFVMALYAEKVYDLVETASSFGTSGILILTLAGVFSFRLRPWIANSILCSGVALSVFFHAHGEFKAPFTLNIFITLLIGVAGIVLARFIEQRGAVASSSVE